MHVFRQWVFTWWEVGLLKVSLISLGILCSLYFTEHVVDFLFMWWVLFLVPALYFMLRIAREK